MALTKHGVLQSTDLLHMLFNGSLTLKHIKHGV